MAERYFPDNVPEEYDPQWLANELSRVAAAGQPVAGVWTPEIWDDSLSGSESQTYSIQYGIYRKTGDLVYVSGMITMTSLGSLTTTQNARIGNLPFQVGTLYSNFESMVFGYAINVSLGGAYALSGLFNPAGNYANLYKWSGATGASPLTLAQLTASGNIRFSGWYMISDIV